MSAPTFRPAEERAYGFDLVEPRRWPCDGGDRRESVLDPNFEPPRVVRRVGWRACMACGVMFFSPDVRSVRMHEECYRGRSEVL